MENERDPSQDEYLEKSRADLIEGKEELDEDSVKQSPGISNGALIEATAKLNHEFYVSETKSLRQELDVRLQILKDSNRKSRERSLAITKLQEAIMWLGIDLKDLGTPNPYPQSYNPKSQVVEPTADGLKL